MTSAAHRIAAALALALLVPGLLAGLSFCGMPECPALVGEQAHHCSQADTSSLSAACCSIVVETPATPVRPSDRLEVGLDAAQAPLEIVVSPVLPATLSFRPASPFRPQLDPLSQSSILRI